MSLWCNVLLLGLDEGGLPDLFDLIDDLADDPRRSKSQRRQLTYYRNRLRQYFEAIAQQAAHDYRLARQRLFDPHREDFPTKRLEDSLTGMRDTRTVEQVAIAFDVCRKRQLSLDLLYGLRQLETLKPLTRQPHGYQQFLDSFAAVRQARSETRPSVTLDALVDYLKAHNEFSDLLDIARLLGLDLGDEWTDMSQRTEGAPLLMLFGSLSEGQKMFLRGLSFQNYLSQRREALVDQTEALELEAERLRGGLAKLRGDIKNLNDRLGKPLLSDIDLVKIEQDIQELLKFLRDAGDLPPAVLYVLFRFSQAALKALEEQRQRWSGDNGIEGWRTRLGDILRWQDTLKRFENQINDIYAHDEQLVGQVIGPKDTIEHHFRSTIDRTVQQTILKLDKSFALSDPIPQIDLSDYTQAIERLQGDMIRYIAIAEKIAGLLTSLENVRARIREIIDQLEVQQ